MQVFIWVFKYNYGQEKVVQITRHVDAIESVKDYDKVSLWKFNVMDKVTIHDYDEKDDHCEDKSMKEPSLTVEMQQQVF